MKTLADIIIDSLKNFNLEIEKEIIKTIEEKIKETGLDFSSIIKKSRNFAKQMNRKVEQRDFSEAFYKEWLSKETDFLKELEIVLEEDEFEKMINSFASRIYASVEVGLCSSVLIPPNCNDCILKDCCKLNS